MKDCRLVVALVGMIICLLILLCKGYDAFYALQQENIANKEIIESLHYTIQEMQEE